MLAIVNTPAQLQVAAVWRSQQWQSMTMGSSQLLIWKTMQEPLVADLSTEHYHVQCTAALLSSRCTDCPESGKSRRHHCQHQQRRGLDCLNTWCSCSHAEFACRRELTGIPVKQFPNTRPLPLRPGLAGRVELPVPHHLCSPHCGYSQLQPPAGCSVPP